MKLMTFNTQHCKAYLAQKIDFDLMADAILQYAPDIVGLNEMYDAVVASDHRPHTAEIALK